MTQSLMIATPQAIQTKADAYILADGWLKALDLAVASGDLALTTRDIYKLGFDKFVDFAASHRRIDANVLRLWIASLRKEHKASAVNTWLAGVRAFFKWAMGEGLIPHDPAAGLRGAKRKGTMTKHSRDTLTDAEVLRVLAQPSPETDDGKRDRAYLYLRAYTGCRDVELHRADLADLQTRSGRLVLMVRGKGHAEADEFVVIKTEAEGPLRDWLGARGDQPGALFTSFSDRSRGQRLSLRAIRRMVIRYYRLAGITEKTKTSHSLRHAAITNAIRHGAPVQKARSMARHADISTTMIYYHETDRVQNPAEEFVRYENETSLPTIRRE